MDRRDVVLQRLGSLVIELGSGVSRTALERDPKRVINQTLRQYGYPSIVDLELPSLQRALRSLEDQQ